MSSAAVVTIPRRRTGRPPKAERRTEFVSYRVTEDEAAAIMARAAAAGMTVSDFARAAAIGAPVRQVRPSGYSPEVVAQLRRAGNVVMQCLREARFGNFPPAVADAAEEALRDLSALLRVILHGPER